MNICMYTASICAVIAAGVYARCRSIKYNKSWYILQDKQWQPYEHTRKVNRLFVAFEAGGSRTPIHGNVQYHFDFQWGCWQFWVHDLKKDKWHKLKYYEG